MKTHTKVWLWIILIANCFTDLSYIPLLLINPIYFLYILASAALILSACLMLFKQKRLGFYIFCVVAVLVFFLNLIMGINIIFALFSAVLGPVITYLFVKGSWDVMS